MLTVHHLGVSQSERIVWLCEELELEYELVRYDRDATSRMAPAEYRALHPLGTAPIITDGAVTLAESGAIVDYILARYGSGRLTVAADEPDFADYLFWLHFANGSLMPRGMMVMVAGAIGGPDAVGLLGQRIDAAYAMIEQRLGTVAYFAGDELTAADILMVFPLTTMRLFTPRDISRYPNILAYLQRIGERPAYRGALAKGDPGLVPMLA